MSSPTDTPPVDPVFAPDEALYIRLDPKYFFTKNRVHGRFVPAHEVHFPKFSVNRGKYSTPERVLDPVTPEWGIAMFRVEHIPPFLVEASNPKQPKRYDFVVVHCPEHGNYAHAEVRSMRDGQEKEPGKTLKLEFRQLLADGMTVLRAPKAAA